ncbi:hypothetical protein BDZ97DRAFT_1769179 [Flammula alnicola]|nr:hypothetical protein BDZ97DRAFT_1769179 [Flammula alnicola]
MPPSAALDVGQTVKPSGTPTPTTDKPRLLTLVLLTSGEGANAKDKEKYAIVRPPASYQEAVASALKALGRYVSDPRAENIELLYPLYDTDGERLWAKTDPEDWDLIMEAVSGKELGVRERVPSDSAFTNGPVILTYGFMKDFRRTWTDFECPEYYGRASWPMIDRPKSYMEAVESIMNGARVNFRDICHSTLYAPPTSLISVSIKKELDSVDLKNCVFKFHVFTYDEKPGARATNFWLDFPEEAYTDVRRWREWVPEPHQILGFTLHRKSSGKLVAEDGMP